MGVLADATRFIWALDETFIGRLKIISIYACNVSTTSVVSMETEFEQTRFMSRIPDISEAEWKVMKILWGKSPQPAYDIVQALAGKEDWHPNTIKTILNRLCRKRALGVTKYKNLFLYHPLVSEEDCVQAESESFLRRFFGGSVKPLLVHFARRQKLSAADLAELKRILEPPGKA
jgi:BlaI family transcriptional regulator, penicillinase repressor